MLLFVQKKSQSSDGDWESDSYTKPNKRCIYLFILHHQVIMKHISPDGHNLNKHQNAHINVIYCGFDKHDLLKVVKSARCFMPVV